jgi:hypothetical protein
MMEAANTFEALVNFYQTTWHKKLENSHIYRYRIIENSILRKIIILPVILYGCETWFLTLWEEH